MHDKYLETIKIIDAKVQHLPYHQKRVDSVIGKGKIDLKSIIEPPCKDGVYRCRVVYDAKGFTIEYIPYVKREIKTLKLVFDDAVVYDKKYANRKHIDALFAKRQECDDVLIVQSLHVTDTSIANIAFFDGLEWITPAKPLLEGTTRARLLDEGKIKVCDIRYDEIKNFQKLALMNAMMDFDIIAQDDLKEVIC